MIDIGDLKQYVIRPALNFLDLYSEAAENLLLGTAAIESEMGYYLHQINGTALGICQMEPNTYRDIWHFYLKPKSKLVLAHNILTYFSTTTIPPAEKMIYDLRYAFVMCRLHYLRVSEPLPEAHDIQKIAEYWKKHYNTKLGKGTTDKFIVNYNKFCKKF
jgi:hypothetical protein